ncbi:hypothetical protein CEB3_c27380 [Peptococcaceae bacterium CEB3]|nr:hypothetical protein CEB3_c27380 [Peptococcaceae bacterium CEB3]
MNKMNYRHKANVTLAVVFLLFVLSTIFKLNEPRLFSLRLLNFVLEAALVGGIADWFAVTALFQRPLGWPFHTALIPRNRDKVILSVSQMVENDLLSLELIQEKLARVSFTDGLRAWVEQNGGVAALTRLLFIYLDERKDKIPARSAQFIAAKIKQEIGSASLDRELYRLSRIFPTGDGLDYALDQLRGIVNGPLVRENLYRLLLDQKETREADSRFNRYLLDFVQKIDGLNLREAATVLQKQLGLALRELENPSHPLRQRILELLATEADTQSLGQTLEQWKTEVLLKLPWEETLCQFLTTVLSQVMNPPKAPTAPAAAPENSAPTVAGDPVPQPNPIHTAENPARNIPEDKVLPEKNSPLFIWLSEGASRLWQDFLKDQPLQNRLNAYIRSTLGRLAAAEHRMIGSIARNTLESLSETDLNSFIEGKAGEDLQWIRINGSLVGGFAGLFLFFFLDLIYQPWLLPLFHRLFPFLNH